VTSISAKRAADQHHVVQSIGCSSFDAHNHTAVIEQQLVVDATILDQVGVIDADDILVAFGQRMYGGKGELITGL